MAHESEEQFVQFPTDPNSYQNLETIGSGASAIVYRAQCGAINSKLVAIKTIDLDKCKDELDIVEREAEILLLHAHPNILRPHCLFSAGRLFRVVMPFMSGGSFESIISASFPNGLPESCIAVVLRETLNALSSLHLSNRVHGDIKASNILLDSDGSVKLADYGISESIYKPKLNHGSSSSSSSLRTNDVAGIHYWKAPEVINSQNEYTFKADIWSFGITALKLAYGLRDLPLSHHNEKNKKNENFTKSFRAMVNSCLDQDPSKRPTAEDLLKHSFFKNCGDSEFLVENVLEGLPSVEESFKTMKQSMNTVKRGQVEAAEGSGGLRNREEQNRKRQRVTIRAGGETVIAYGRYLADMLSVSQVVKRKEIEVGKQSIDASEGTAQVEEEEEETIEAAASDPLAEDLKLLHEILEEQREQMLITIQRLHAAELADLETVKEYLELKERQQEEEKKKQKCRRLDRLTEFLDSKISASSSSSRDSGSSSGGDHKNA